MIMCLECGHLAYRDFHSGIVECLYCGAQMSIDEYERRERALVGSDAKGDQTARRHSEG